MKKRTKCFHTGKKHSHKKCDDDRKKEKYANPSSIVIPDVVGPATPFPSQIVVSDLEKCIKEVIVTIHGFSHTFPAHVHMMLVSPEGRAVYLMGEAGNGYPVTNLTITFDDDAPYNLPFTQALRIGRFRPTVYSVIPQLTGPQQYESSLRAFKGENPNGTWSLYVFDPVAGHQGMIANVWSLKIATE